MPKNNNVRSFQKFSVLPIFGTETEKLGKKISGNFFQSGHVTSSLNFPMWLLSDHPTS